MQNPDPMLSSVHSHTPLQSPTKGEANLSRPYVPFSTPTAENVSAIHPQSESSLPPSPSLSQCPSSSVSHRSIPEGTVDVNSLSARSRQRYFKNLKILNDDSLFTDESLESVAHVEYFCNGSESNQHDITYIPDDEFYKQAVVNQPLPLTVSPEDHKEAGTDLWSPRQSRNLKVSGAGVVQPDIEELINTQVQTDAIPNLDDSITM